MIQALRALSVHALAALAGVQGEPRAEFEARLAEAQAALAARKFEQAKQIVLDAVRAHPDQDFVLYDWYEIEDLLTEASFWKGYTPPKPADVVSGELLSWDESSGNIKLRYRRSAGQLQAPAPRDEKEEESADTRSGDFYVSDEVLMHPLMFKGPYSIELSGSDLDFHEKLPLVFVAWQWDSLRGLDYGEAYGVQFGEPTGILRVAGGHTQVVGTGSNLLRYGRAYSFELSVGKSTISTSYNDKLLVKVDRQKGEWGQFGFGSFDGLDEVVVDGEIEPSWITGLVDERLQRDASKFRETFDALALLPEWLKTRVEGTSERAAEFGKRLPAPTGAKDDAAIQKTAELLVDGTLDEAIAYVRTLAAPEVGPSLADWLLAHLLARDGKLAEALEHCRSICRADPHFYEARLMEARLARGLGNVADARRALEELVLAFPTYVDTYEDLVKLELGEGLPAEARKALEAAVDNGVSPRALLRAGKTVRRSEHGPSFGKSFSWDTKNYVVTSNLSREACYELATELEEFHQKYVIHVRRPKDKAETKARVYFFSGVAGYDAYTEDLLGDPAENTLGFYSPWLKQLVIWNSPDKRMVLRTARHEGFHQYLDQITSEAPVWLNEGMAEYFEQARRVEGKWKDDQIDPDHLAVLRRVKWTPLQEFVYFDNAGFRAKSGLHYPEGWALVHFLMNGGAAPKKRIDALLDALFEGATRVQALDRAFGGADWKGLEAEFRAYVASLG